MARATRRIEWRRNREEERNDEEDSREPSDLWTRHRHRHLPHLTLRTSPSHSRTRQPTAPPTPTQSSPASSFRANPSPRLLGRGWIRCSVERGEGCTTTNKHYLIINHHLHHHPLDLDARPFRPNLRVHLLFLLRVGFDPRAFGQGQPRKSSKPPTWRLTLRSTVFRSTWEPGCDWPRRIGHKLPPKLGSQQKPGIGLTGLFCTVDRTRTSRSSRSKPCNASHPQPSAST